MQRRGGRTASSSLNKQSPADGIFFKMKSPTFAISTSAPRAAALPLPAPFVGAFAIDDFLRSAFAIDGSPCTPGDVPDLRSALRVRCF